MAYKVVPFKATISSSGTPGDAASQVQSIIQQHVSEGWEFVSCGNIDTTIAASGGCFGVGGTPASNTSVMVLVFKQ